VVSKNPSPEGESEVQTVETVHVGTKGRVHRCQRFSENRARLVTSLLQAEAFPAETEGGGSETSGPRTKLLTVKEVATILRVCTATVYDMVERGELTSVRVSNAIRVVLVA